MKNRRNFLESAFGAAMAAASAAPQALAAQKYPSRPVQVWVGFPGGGALDVATRIVTEAMADEGIRPIVVMNRPGASATIAAAQVARQEADGYNLLLATSSNIGIARYLYPKLPFDIDRDFAPVARFALGQNVIYAGRQTQVNTFADLMARVRSRPGKLNYASPGTGTTPHLCFEMLKARARIFVVHVPFGGSPMALTAAAAGEVEFGVDAIGPSQAFIRSGRIKPLAQTGERRSAALPDVPTLRELGFAGLPPGTSLALSAPAGTPAAVHDALRAAVRASTTKPAVMQRLNDVGFDANYLEGAALVRAMHEEQELWRAAVRYSGAGPT